METICEKCYGSFSDTAAIITVKVGKPHMLCIMCWEGVRPRWFRSIKKFFPLQSVEYAMSLYIHYDAPVRHFNPLDVEFANPSMA
jgi:hypothetical protein